MLYPLKICLYFQVHQPYRLNNYHFFQIGRNEPYENESLNKSVLKRVCENGYLKTNKLFQELIGKYAGKFSFGLSFSGVFLEQLSDWQPHVLESFKNLVNTGHVEVLSETYYHSLAWLYNKSEFEAQVQKHSDALKNIFNLSTPITFRNTELIYNNSLYQWAKESGYKCILTEGAERVLNQRTPNQLFTFSEDNNWPYILVRNYSLSDEISFRFSDKNSPNYPLSPKKFLNKLAREPQNSNVVNIYMDFETFGEHHSEDSGIFTFMKGLVNEAILQGHEFVKPCHAAAEGDVCRLPVFESNDYISWADTEKDLSAWLSNSMQYEALQKVYALREKVLATHHPQIIHKWRKLLTSDHFYYMCTKHYNDGAVHSYFSPFASPYDSYIYYMNVISDFELLLKRL